MGLIEKCPACGLLFLGSRCPACVSAPPAPAAAPEKAVGFPGLELIGPLGRGGMGTVYQARQAALGRLVAVKVLPSEKAGQGDFSLRFEREAKTLSELSHPNIVALFDFGRHEGSWYFVMEFVEGRSLRERMKSPIPRDEAFRIAAGVCDALAFAHAKGIVHRDIKPENILLDAKGTAKLADFGLARPHESDLRLTQTGAAMGTLAYAAPEQRDDPRKADARSDLFSLGIVLHEMLTGERPPGPDAEPAVRRATDPDPAKRFADAAAMKAALPLAVPVRKGRSWIVAVVPLLLAVGIGLALRPWRSEPKPEPRPLLFLEASILPTEGQVLACGDGVLATSGSPEIRLWRDGARIGTLTGHTGRVRSIAFRPDGGALASAGADTTIRIWSVDEGRTIQRIFAHTDECLSVAWSGDGALLASGDAASVKIWRASDGHPYFTLPESPGVTALAFGGAHTLVCAGTDGRIRVWSVGERKWIRTLEGSRFAVTPDGLKLAVGQEGQVRVLDVPSGGILFTIPHAAEVLAFHPTDGWLTTAGEDVRIWDAGDGKPLATLRGSSSFHALALGSRPKTVVAGTRDGRVYVWAAASAPK